MNDGVRRWTRGRAKSAGCPPRNTRIAFDQSGCHIALREAVDAQFGGLPGAQPLRAFDRLRRRRNTVEYLEAAIDSPKRLRQLIEPAISSSSLNRSSTSCHHTGGN